MAGKRSRNQDSQSASWTDSLLLKLSSKLVLLVVIVAVFLTLTQCTVKKPESPTWTTQLTVPLLNHTYQMSEIIDKIDQEGIGMDADSNVVYTVTRDIDTITLNSDELTTSNVSLVANEQLGPVEIDPPNVNPVSVPVIDIAPLAAFIPGVVPATSFNINNSIPQITSYTTVTISSGQAYAIVGNALGIDLSPVTIELFDISSGQSFGTQAIAGGIADGATDTVVFTLDGRTMSNSLQTRVSASTPGGAVLSAAGKSLTTDIDFGNALTVSSATAEVPALSRSFSAPVSLNESDPIYSASFYSGTIELDIDNQTNLDAQLDIGFPDVVLGGVPLTIQRTVSANSSTTVSADISGYDLVPSDSTVPQDLSVDMAASTMGTAPLHIDVDQFDEFTLTANLYGLRFNSATGPFSAVGSTISPRQEEIDVPSGFDSLQLVSAMLTLEVVNGVNLPGSLDITLQGNNGKNINFSGNIAAGLPGTPVTSFIVDSAVADFLSPPPSLIDISGSASFGDGSTVGTIASNDFICGRMSILAPLEMIINQTTVQADIEREEVNQDDIDVITDHVVEARLLYNITNHLPLGTSIRIFLGGDSTFLYANPQLLIDDISIIAAPVTGGIASDVASTGYQAVILDSLDLQVLKNDTLFIGTELTLEDSNGQPVKLTNNDFVTVTGRIEVEYIFDGDF